MQRPAHNTIKPPNLPPPRFPGVGISSCLWHLPGASCCATLKLEQAALLLHLPCGGACICICETPPQHTTMAAAQAKIAEIGACSSLTAGIGGASAVRVCHGKPQEP